MIKGAVDFLLSDCREAKFLRKKCVFKIVPMLNPDGVVYGNYRCSLLGVDLNRRWKHPSAIMHPTIYYTKKLVKILTEEREVSLFCDFHGHSIKRNAFAYACSYRSQDSVKNKENLLIRLVPFVLDKVNPMFSYEFSHFRTEKSKQGTARVVNFKENKILTSYTLEASFYGSKNINSHFSIRDLELIGKDLCSSCSVFVSKKDFAIRVQQLSEYLKAPHLAKSSPKAGLLTDSKSRPSLSLQRSKEGISSVEEDSKIDMKDSDDSQDSKNFNINDELEKINDSDLEKLLIFEENSDSGGSDSQASFNDEKKIKFLLKKSKKLKKKKARKSESPQKITQIIQNSSFSQAKNISETPDIVLKSRPKSRNTLRKHSELITKQIIPTKIMLRSPFIEENSDSRSYIRAFQTSSRSMFREAGPVKPLKKLNDFLKDMNIYDSSVLIKEVLNKSKKKKSSISTSYNLK